MRHIKYIATIAFLLYACSAAAQYAGSNRIALVEQSAHQYAVELTLSQWQWQTVGEAFSELVANEFNARTTTVGRPSLPTWSRLITLPDGATTQLFIEENQVATVSFATEALIPYPAQAPHIKNEPTHFAIDNRFYALDTFHSEPLASLQIIGKQRGTTIARLTIAPFECNPRRKQLRIHTKVKVVVSVNSPSEAPSEQSERYSSPYFDQIHKTVGLKRYAPVNSSTNAPVVYAIVTPSRYKETLQPFANHKTAEGFDVEWYTCDDGNREALKARLNQRYLRSTNLNPAPTFILIVGDYDDIPPALSSEKGSLLGTHITDQYYAEYTGDHLPEALIGRWSVENESQLQDIVAKTIEYEQCRMSDTAYLNRIMLVAGAEEREPAPRTTNGQVAYLNQAFGELNSQTERHLFTNPQSEQSLSEIVQTLSRGISHLNYTAHCFASGWHRPSFTTATVDSLPEDRRYFFSINNCCQSNNFQGYCLGEALLRKPNGGAIGVVGATHETLWEEDYYWSVGSRQHIDSLSSYERDALGAFDRLLHRHDEPRSEWVTTAGEMIHAGNFAVEQQGSPFNKYYWEVYELLGDPSLMPLIGVPAELPLSLINSITKGDTTICVQTTSHARVALVEQDRLLGAAMSDSNGRLLINLRQPLTADTVSLTATAAGFRPTTLTLTPLSAPTAMVVATNPQIIPFAPEQEPTIGLGDTVSLAVRWKNVGNQAATNCELSLIQTGADSATSTIITPLQSSHQLPHIDANSDTTVVFSFIVHPTSATDQLALSLRASANNAITTNQRHIYNLERAILQTERVQLTRDHRPAKALAASTEYTLSIEVANTASRPARQVAMLFTPISGIRQASPYQSEYHPVAALGSQTFEFPFSTADTISTCAIAIALQHDGTTLHDTLYWAVGKDIEDFESGTFQTHKWDTTSAHPWQIVTNKAHSSTHSVATPPMNDRTESRLSITFRSNADDTLSFHWAISSQTRADALRCEVDGSVRATISGERDWQKQSVRIAPGKHTVEWIYEKDDSLSSGSDRAWLDDISFPFCSYSHAIDLGDTATAPTQAITPTNAHPPLLVYPNPCKDHCTIICTQQGTHTVKLYDTQGRLLDIFFLEEGQPRQYDTSHLRFGIYLLTVDDGNTPLINKLAIVR